MRLASRSVGAVLLVSAVVLGPARSSLAEDGDASPPAAATQRQAAAAEGETRDDEGPPLPEEMSLDDVLDRAGRPPPEGYPQVVPDDHLRAFLLADRVDYRFDPGAGADQVGFELQSWFGGDFNRLWLKVEGEGLWQGVAGFAGETESDLLYSRLVSPFWNLQVGARYANEWSAGDHEDLLSGVLALQGMAPGMFEVDLSLYLSEALDLSLVLEVEYDLRLGQRLVLQPRAELAFAAQDVPERGIGAGMTDAVVDLRLRYELKREFAPYLGARLEALVGETAQRARDAGEDPVGLYLLAGLRFALY